MPRAPNPAHYNQTIADKVIEAWNAGDDEYRIHSRLSLPLATVKLYAKPLRRIATAQGTLSDRQQGRYTLPTSVQRIAIKQKLNNGVHHDVICDEHNIGRVILMEIYREDR